MCVFLYTVVAAAGGDQSWDILARWGYLPPHRIWEGAWWSLVSSAVIHLALWHVAFNVYWLWELDGAAELPQPIDVERDMPERQVDDGGRHEAPPRALPDAVGRQVPPAGQDVPRLVPARRRDDGVEEDAHPAEREGDGREAAPFVARRRDLAARGDQPARRGEVEGGVRAQHAAPAAVGLDHGQAVQPDVVD